MVAATAVPAPDSATVVLRAPEPTGIMPAVTVTMSVAMSVAVAVRVTVAVSVAVITRVRGRVVLAEGESVLLVRRKAGSRAADGVPPAAPDPGPGNPEEDRQDDESHEGDDSDGEDVREVSAEHVLPRAVLTGPRLHAGPSWGQRAHAAGRCHGI
ncbi:hypothetical protein GXW82_12655 [Streptacidiphilus sp. 4-A2]|nr:hypothetical protein [Streptacidiphilus sp. 4-A2]